MPAREPQDVHRRFVESFNAGDIDALMTLYEPNAAIIPQPGQLVAGADGVRGVLTQFLALKGTITIDTRTVAQAGELALLHSDWALKGTGPEGQPIELSGTRLGFGLNVLVRNPNCSMKPGLVTARPTLVCSRPPIGATFCESENRQVSSSLNGSLKSCRTADEIVVPVASRSSTYSPPTPVEVRP